MPRKIILGLSILLVAASLGFGALPAGAAPQRPVTQVSVLPIAQLTDDGAAITARVRIRCQPNGVMWEGFISAEQGDVGFLIGMPLVCDGRQHIEDVVIPVGDPTRGSFDRGEAIVRALILDEGTLDIYSTDTRTVKVM